MQHSYTRVLLIAAYAVVLLEVALPFVDHPSRVDNPLWQSVGLAFAVLNIASLATLRPRPLRLVLAALNGVLAGATIIRGSVMLLRDRPPSLSDLDFLAAVCFFAGVVPFVTAAFLYKAASRLTLVGGVRESR